MNKKILLFGATGNLGYAIARALHDHGYLTTAAVRNSKQAGLLQPITEAVMEIDFESNESLKGIAAGFDIVISALGKSVSPFDRSKGRFREIDLDINRKILEEAIVQKVSKFVYISALAAEQYPGLEYFAVHHEMTELVKLSGIEYLIVKPPALFSAFIDLMKMAGKGQLVTIGNGEKKTNPISENDLAEIIVQQLDKKNPVIEAGGPEILSRKQINEIIQKEINPGKKVRSIPMGLIKSILPVVKIFDRNSYDKMAFFLEVMQHDLQAPVLGQEKLADYVKRKKSSFN